MRTCKGGDLLKIMPAKTPISPHFSEDFSFKYKVTYGPEQHEYHTHKQFDIIFMLTPNTVCHVSEKNWKVPKNSIILFNNMDLRTALRKNIPANPFPWRTGIQCIRV